MPISKLPIRVTFSTLVCAAASITASTVAHATATVIAQGSAVAFTTSLPAAPAIHGTTTPIRAACPAGNDPNVRDLEIQTTSLGIPSSSVTSPDPVYVRVITPTGWSATSTQTWPVLYLLTGHGASYASWTCDTFVEQYLQNAGVIVVMPDGTRAYSLSDPPDSLTGGIPSMYSNWVNHSTDGSLEDWETFHINELQPIIESMFHGNSTRAVAGLSLGGLGAMDYAARHPGMFVAAASYSGYTHTRSSIGESTENGILLLANQDTNAPWNYIPDTLGAYLYGTQWPEHDPTELASALINIPLFVSAGNGTPANIPGSDNSVGAETLETGVHSLNLDFVAALKSANGGVARPKLITDFYGNGTHSWAYWDAEICRSIPMLIRNLLGISYSPGVCPIP